MAIVRRWVFFALTAAAGFAAVMVQAGPVEAATPGTDRPASCEATITVWDTPDVDFSVVGITWDAADVDEYRVWSHGRIVSTQPASDPRIISTPGEGWRPGVRHFSIQGIKDGVASSLRTYCGSVTIPDFTPDTPTVCNVHDFGTGIEVSWNAEGADGYYVIRNGRRLFRTPGNESAFVDSSARSGRTYHYSVIAVRYDENAQAPVPDEEYGPRIYCGGIEGTNDYLPAPAACTTDKIFTGTTVRWSTVDRPVASYRLFIDGVADDNLVVGPGDQWRAEASRSYDRAAESARIEVQSVGLDGSVSERVVCQEG